jgi:hypothetical protein
VDSSQSRKAKGGGGVMSTLEQILNAVVNAARADALGHSYFDCHCVDCGVNTAPAIWRGRQVEPALPKSWELYWVKDKVWAAAGMGELDGSLCVGCIEARLGRRLRPKDFDFKRSENRAPSHWYTSRLAARRGDAA